MKANSDFPNLIVQEDCFIDPLFPHKSPKSLEVSVTINPAVIKKLQEEFGLNINLLVPVIHVLRVRFLRSLTDYRSGEKNGTMDLKSYAEMMSRSLNEMLSDFDLDTVGAKFHPCYYPEQIKVECSLTIGLNDPASFYVNPKDLSTSRVLH